MLRDGDGRDHRVRVVLGAPAPAVRSAVMLGVVAIAELLQRPTHPWTALALGAVIPAINRTWCSILAGSSA
jgi:hypothetical protein